MELCGCVLVIILDRADIFPLVTDGSAPWDGLEAGERAAWGELH